MDVQPEARCVIELLSCTNIHSDVLNQEVLLSYSAGCDPIPVEYLRWGDPEPIAAVVFACLGQMATFFVTAVFIR